VQFRLIWIVVAILIAQLLVACGGDSSDGEDDESLLGIERPDLVVHDAWMRPAVLPEGSPTPDPAHADHEQHTGVLSAMYLVIDNGGSQAVQLVAVETGVARVAELHETQNQNGLMRMRRVEHVDVPANSEVTFEPGGHHIMLIDISQPLELGDEVTVTLIFNTGERITVSDVQVRDS
jgi:copper(I)-binding protein